MAKVKRNYRVRREVKEQPRKLERVKALERELLKIDLAEKRALAKSNFLAFIRYTKPDYKIAWFHRLMAEYIEKLARGEIRKLMIFLPPRRGKSEQTSRRLPAYAFGINPNEKIIACSYGGDLALMMSRDVQNIMRNPSYYNLFPDSILPSLKPSKHNKKYVEQSDYFEIVDAAGYYRSAGVMGAITGMGATLGIIDDYSKDPLEATSLTYRQRAWDWYRAAFLTRLEKGARQLVTATRWHEADLAGRILAAPGGKDWTVLKYPEIKETDEDETDPRDIGACLWPEMYETTEAGLVEAFGSYFYSALFQQRPAPSSGEYFKPENWRFYKTLPDKFDRIIAVWDLNRGKDTRKSKKASYNCGLILGKKDASIYFIWLYRQRGGFTETKQAIINMKKARPEVGKIIVERAAAGDAAIDMLEKEIPGLVGKTPKGDKSVRADAVQHIHEAQQCYLPEPSSAAWVEPFISELASFPNAPNDDQFDVAVYGLEEMTGGFNIDVKIESFAKSSKWKNS